MSDPNIHPGGVVSLRARAPRVVTWLRLVRPHHAPLSLSPGIAGMVIGASHPTSASIALGVVGCAFGYGIGQVVNDYTDRHADAINAPDRPFVTGAINPVIAISAVTVATIVMIALSTIVAPGLAIWGAVAIVGHVVYSLTKGIPILGNVSNGVDLAVFTLMGAAATAPDRAWNDIPSEVLLAAGLMATVLAGFALTSYFKDIDGDRAAGFRTLPVVAGTRVTAWAIVPFFLVAVAVLTAIAIASPDALGANDGAAAAGAVFWVLLMLAAGAFAMAVADSFRAPIERAFEAVRSSVRGVVLFGLALAAVADPTLIAIVAVPVVAFLEIAYRDTRETRNP